MRHLGFESGLVGMRTSDGTRVTVDVDEQRVLGHGGGTDAETRQREANAACAAVSAVATGLHMVNHFTDGWAVDGSFLLVLVSRCVGGVAPCLLVWMKN